MFEVCCCFLTFSQEQWSFNSKIYLIRTLEKKSKQVVGKCSKTLFNRLDLKQIVGEK